MRRRRTANRIPLLRSSVTAVALTMVLVFPSGVAASYRRGEQAAGIGELAPEIGRGNAMALGQCREPVEPAGVEYVGADDERAGPAL